MEEQNITMSNDELCQNSTEDIRNSSSYCGSIWDGISCWPSVPAGTTANISCFAELKGIQYDINDSAFRVCLENGIWANRSNYSFCKPLVVPDDDDIQVLWDTKDAANVYYVGYGLSLIALTLALTIFLRFKELKCLRNNIHTNLMLTYFLIDATWICTMILQSDQNSVAKSVSCFLTILLMYLMGTNFFWMFVEGLYLFVLVVRTFTVDNVKLRVYVVIGWGIPAVVAFIWATVKNEHTANDPLQPQNCPWQVRDNYDYIFVCPVVLVLLINIVFLLKVMWVLITKLQASNTLESKQYRKAAKALVVLIPLLGVTYILLITAPSGRTAEVVFTYIQAALLSVQGFIVAILYCFLNGEVQNSLKHRLERWRVRKAIKRGHFFYTSTGKGSHFACNSGYRGVHDSCGSFSTSVSIVNYPCAISPRSPMEAATLVSKIVNCGGEKEEAV